MPILKLHLTTAQLEKLQETICFSQDEGPSPEGWKSNLLEEVEKIVNDKDNVFNDAGHDCSTAGANAEPSRAAAGDKSP